MTGGRHAAAATQARYGAVQSKQELAPRINQAGDGDIMAPLVGALFVSAIVPSRCCTGGGLATRPCTHIADTDRRVVVLRIASRQTVDSVAILAAIVHCHR